MFCLWNRSHLDSPSFSRAAKLHTLLHIRELHDLLFCFQNGLVLPSYGSWSGYCGSSQTPFRMAFLRFKQAYFRAINAQDDAERKP